MIKFIDKILRNFRNCFSREATFNWFVIVVIGLMVRTDNLGVTSIIRDLDLTHKCYAAMIHFFHSSAYSLETIANRWFETVKENAPIYKEGDAVVLIGDGVKQAKEARKMPGVKKLHQESENSSKAQYIFGHMFGSIGILAGNLDNFFCIPLLTTLHDGIKIIFNWQEKQEEEVDSRQGSHIVQIVDNAFKITKVFGKSILLLDSYYLSVTALLRLNQLNKDNGCKMEIVTKAKSNCVAYGDPVRKLGRGRPPKKGKTIKLISLFETEKNCFKSITIELYGKTQTVRYYTVELLWGQKLYQKLKFVLVDFNGKKSILVSTDLNLSARSIIRLYSYRFKIEFTFRELKQVISGFSYRFWSKSMPKLKRYKKKNELSEIETIYDPKKRQLIIDKIHAIEGYVMFSCIALGILQILSMKFSEEVFRGKIRFMRTPSKSIVSEATMSNYLYKIIFRSLAKNKDLSISRIIKKKQDNIEKINYYQAS